MDARSRGLLVERRQIQLLLARALDGFVVAGIGVAHDAGARIVPEHARDALARRFRTITNDDNAAVLRIAHADAAAMMQRHPGRAARRVEERIEQRARIFSVSRLGDATLPLSR